jgi:RHH-type transcriptional regulator, rel operon repressor / antitoxin RelB
VIAPISRVFCENWGFVFPGQMHSLPGRNGNIQCRGPGSEIYRIQIFGLSQMATSIRLSAKAEQRLDYLAAPTGRTKAFYLRQMIESRLDGKITIWRLMFSNAFRKGEQKIHSSPVVRADPGLDHGLHGDRQETTEEAKLNKRVSRPILEFLDERVAPQEDPGSSGKAPGGPLDAL